MIQPLVQSRLDYYGCTIGILVVDRHDDSLNMVLEENIEQNNYLLFLYGKFLPKLSVIFSIITLEGLSQSAEPL